MSLSKTLFPLGKVLVTPGALEALSNAKEPADTFLARHQSGDWGSLSDEDRAANTLALVTGERILSAYRTAPGAALWIITKGDRTTTTILLPDEY